MQADGFARPRRRAQLDDRSRPRSRAGSVRSRGRGARCAAGKRVCHERPGCGRWRPVLPSTLYEREIALGRGIELEDARGSRSARGTASQTSPRRPLPQREPQPVRRVGGVRACRFQQEAAEFADVLDTACSPTSDHVGPRSSCAENFSADHDRAAGAHQRGPGRHHCRRRCGRAAGNRTCGRHGVGADARPAKKWLQAS